MSGQDTSADVKKSGEKRIGQGKAGPGRPKGVPNNQTGSLKGLARQYTAEAIEALVNVMRTETGAAKVSAANGILDRGYGKPSTVLSGDEDGNPAKLVHEIILRGVNP